jgi:hypothetical protein
MKFIAFFLLLFAVHQVNPQEFEIKVVSNKYQTVKGQLKKVDAEGIGVEDYKGNYLIFRPTDIVRVKIRKRGLTIGEGAASGALGGLVIGGLLIAAEAEISDQSSAELYKLTAALGAIGGAVGTIVGVVAELNNTKLILKINENPNNYQLQYQKLAPYLNKIVTHHIN